MGAAETKDEKMRVIAINGSPHKNGNTANLLDVAAQAMCAKGLQVDIVHIGSKVYPCTACYQCSKTRNGKCSIEDDALNSIYLELVKAQGILFASPVHYGSIAGGMKCFMDRLFYVDSFSERKLAQKVGAALSVTRRSGGLTALANLNSYLLAGNMVVASSLRWPAAFGMLPKEALSDTEGRQAVHALGENIAWLVKSLNSPQAICEKPKMEKVIRMNFIR